LSKFRWASILLASAAVVLAFSAAAQAATVTLGNPLTGPPSVAGNCTEPTGCTSAILDMADPSAQAAAPFDGTIERWRVAGAGETFGYQLHVLRSEGAGLYTVTASSAPVEPEGNFIETFVTSLPIHAGELIALNVPGAIALYETESIEAFFTPPLESGETRLAEDEGFRPFLLGFNADVSNDHPKPPPPPVTPAPTIAAIGPASGSFKGGTSVTVTGANLSGATGVTFGGVATSFNVVSPSQIIAVAPRLQPGSPVTIAISTRAGTATSASSYTPTACLVPKLNGKTLTAAKKALRAAECRVGNVKTLKGATASSGKVFKHNRRPGAYLPPGAKVNLIVRG
jgi:hypothetical protein